MSIGRPSAVPSHLIDAGGRRVYKSGHSKAGAGPWAFPATALGGVTSMWWTVPGARRLIVEGIRRLASVAVVAAVVIGVRSDKTATPTALTAPAAQAAIQTYLDALIKDDVEVISRNMLCGLYDGVRDRRSDNALARLSSDAFQKQFTRVDVTSIDTMVFASANSAQVLFTMRVIPAIGSRTARRRSRR